MYDPMSHCLAEEPGGRATHWVAVHPLAIIRQRFSTQGMLPSWRNAMFADAHHTIGYLSRNKFIQGQKIKPFRHFFACCVGAKVLDHGMNMTCSKRHFMQAPMQALTLLLLGAIEDGGRGYMFMIPSCTRTHFPRYCTFLLHSHESAPYLPWI